MSHPTDYDSGKNLNQTMTNQRQLELGFEQARAFQLAHRRQPKPSRAQWWFQQMRQAVDQALDWQPVPAAPPQQTWLELTKRWQRA